MRFSYSSLKLSENRFHLALLVIKKKSLLVILRDGTQANRKFSYTKRQIVYT